MTLKLSEEQLAKWGFTTQEEVIAALEKSKEPPKVVSDPELAAGESNTLFDTLETLRLSVAAQNTALAKLEASFKTISPETLLASASAEAKRVASAEVSAAIAKSGGAALTTKIPTDVEQPKNPAGDDYGAQYDSDVNIRAEFLEKANYVTYMEALASGRIRVMQKSSVQQ